MSFHWNEQDKLVEGILKRLLSGTEATNVLADLEEEFNGDEFTPAGSRRNPERSHLIEANKKRLQKSWPELYKILYQMPQGGHFDD